MMKRCEFCGKTYKTDRMADAYMGDNCFDCSFWLKKLHLGPEDKIRQTIIGGQHYMLGKGGYFFKGRGGRKFHILFYDGREVKTTNLWEQGEIPEEFRELLPDNATFIPVENPEQIIFDGSEIPF